MLPDKTNVPDPALVKAPPEIIPVISPSAVFVILNVPALLKLIAPALNVEPVVVKLLNAEVPPIAPLNAIDPVPALIVNERAVPSLLTVLANETLPELELIV